MAKQINLEKALLNPEDVFKDPKNVLLSELRDREKLTILKLWAYDVELLKTADEENMCSDEECGVRLSKIQKVILELKEKMKKK